MDAAFPLRFSEGGLKTVATKEKQNLDRAEFTLNTIRGERYLFPEFGLDHGILFDPQFPAAVKQNVDKALSALDVDSEVEITGGQPGEVQLRVVVGNGAQQQTITRRFPG